MKTKLFVLVALLLIAVPVMADDNLAFTRLVPLGDWNPNVLQPGQTITALYDASRMGDGPGATLDMTVTLQDDLDNILEYVVDVPQSVGSNWSIANVGTQQIILPATDGLYKLVGCLNHQDPALASGESNQADNCQTLTLCIGDCQNNSSSGGGNDNGGSSSEDTILGTLIAGSIIIQVDGIDFQLSATNDCGSNNYFLPYSLNQFPESYVVMLFSIPNNMEITVSQWHCSNDVAVVDLLGL